MQEFENQLVCVRVDGVMYEGYHRGFHSRGPFEFHILEGTRFINWQNCEGPNRTTNGEDYNIPGKVYLPVGPTTIHPTHLQDRV